MESIFYNGVDIFNPLNGKKDKVIEYFVNFYGEKYREIITKKVYETTFIFMPYTSPALDEAKYIDSMCKIQDNRVKKLQMKLYEKFGFYLVDLYGEPIDIDVIISTKQKLLNNLPLTKEEKSVVGSLIEKFPNASNAQIVAKMEEFIFAHKKVVSGAVNQLMGERQNIILKLRDLVPKIKEIQKQHNINVLNIIRKHFKNNFISNDNLSEAEYVRYEKTFIELVKNCKMPLILTTNQREKYVNLFKFLGFDLGDDYKDYYQNEKLVNTLFSNSFVEEIESEMENYDLACKECNPVYMAAKQKIDALEIEYDINKEDLIDAISNFVCNQGYMGLEIPYVERGSKELKGVCICGDYLSTSTETIIHELNHIIEDCIVKEDESTIYTKSGFDLIPFQKFEDDNYSFYEIFQGDVRMFETISEIVNEYISINISNQMKKDGFSLGIAEEKRSLYYSGFYIFGGFIEDNLDIIKESRFSQDFWSLGKYIGVEEFKKLATVADDVITSDYFDVDEAIDEISAKLHLDKNNYMAFCKIADKKDSCDWTKNAKKFFIYLERVNSFSQKLKEGYKKHNNEVIK